MTACAGGYDCICAECTDRSTRLQIAEQEAERMRALMGDEWADGMYD